MTRSFLVLCTLGALSALYACSSSRDSEFGNPDDKPDGGDPTTFDPSKQDASGCTGLACNVVDCGGGTTTTLTGTVFAPTPSTYGDPDPIYNAIVYIPNGELQPFPTEVSCDKCGTVTSGSPIVTALSGSDGKFTLENVPSGDDIPFVIQVGRWRREVRIPHVEACQTTELDAEQTRLPRNKKEGDIPQMAIVTSTYDPTECILRKIGIDVAEFTSPDEDGRVHLYKGSGATLSSGTLPAASTLWQDEKNLDRYDLVAFPCQTTATYMPSGAGLANVEAYAGRGGRVFITDLAKEIIKASSEWKHTAAFDTSFFQNPATIDTSFPKGAAFAEWLDTVGATTSSGELELEEVSSSASSLGTSAQRWIYSEGANVTETYSFNTPVDAAEDAQCGRVVYSGFHIATQAGSTFPSECTKLPLTPQEKTLEFMLFDLAACIQKDDTKPTPPPVK